MASDGHQSSSKDHIVPLEAPSAACSTDVAREPGASGTLTPLGRLRSTSKKIEESNPPLGMCEATAAIASSIPPIADVQRAFGSQGWTAEGQIKDGESRNSLVRHDTSCKRGDSPESPCPGSSRYAPRARDSMPELCHDILLSVTDPKNHEPGVISADVAHNGKICNDHISQPQNESIISTDKYANHESNITPTATIANENSSPKYRKTPFNNGYQFPPKHTWTESTIIGLKGFWGYATTWFGFFVILYGLNIVAWGGMIFLLLCNAAPAMCSPTCDDINSPRREWVEYDSQILTALFCVTGFGLIPWRFRDLYYLLKYRLGKDEMGLRRLAGIHREWFRLEGSQNLPELLGPKDIETDHDYPTSSLTYPLNSISEAPLTGIRAPPTPRWKLDFVIWMFVWNTFLQAVLSGLMWGINRYDRPAWSVGLFVALACIVAACAGIVMFLEGKKIKRVEGVFVSLKDKERLQKDRELGIEHWNNVNDRMPKENGKGQMMLLGKSVKKNGLQENTGKITP